MFALETEMEINPRMWELPQVRRKGWSKTITNLNFLMRTTLPFGSVSSSHRLLLDVDPLMAPRSIRSL
jgi:hypothetical protein